MSSCELQRGKLKENVGVKINNRGCHESFIVGCIKPYRNTSDERVLVKPSGERT